MLRALRKSKAKSPYSHPRVPGSIAAACTTSNVVTTSELGAAIRGSEAVPTTCPMPIMTPGPAIVSVPIVIEPPSSSIQEQQIHQHVADYGQGITANPGTAKTSSSRSKKPSASTMGPGQITNQSTLFRSVITKLPRCCKCEVFV